MGKSPRLAILLAGTPLLCLCMLALFLSLACDSGVWAVTFDYSGFQGNDLYFVPDIHWIFDDTTGCIQFNADKNLFNNASGRFLYPGGVQMIDPGSTTVKSFSTTFIFQLRFVSDDGYTGPGMAFIIVPDNDTIEAPGDSMGLITSRTFDTAKNYESDDHTLGVELDTHKNPEFNDTNNNHIGINLASMNSTYSFEPPYSLSTSNAILYRQTWIDYDEGDSRMDIYYANYRQRKPAKPQGSQSGLNLTLLKEMMFVGFSTANKIGSFDAPSICAWSFSNDDIPAPSIVMAQDATPDGPVAAPSLPPPTSIPSPPHVPTQSPAPSISSPPPPPASNPSPFNPPNSPPSSSVFPQGPNGESPTITKKGGKKLNLAGVYVGVSIAVGLCLFVFCCWLKFLSHPLHVFISHAGSEDGSGIVFPRSLRDRMDAYKWSFSTLSNITFFFDRENLNLGLDFPKEIFAELAQSNVGLVVVTDDFFRRRWPMTELLYWKNALENDTTRKLRVLPLFFKLTLKEVKDGLKDGTWEDAWEEMSKANHPLEVDECRDAVKWLCTRSGIEYCYNDHSHDGEYIEKICKGLDKVLCQERSFVSYLRRAITCFCVPRNPQR